VKNNKNLFCLLLSVFIIAVLFIVAVLSAYFYNFNGEISPNSDKWGVFGDFIGGSLNPVFSFLALIALLVTLWLQSKQTEISIQELKISRKELTETRKELSRSAEAQEASVNHQKRQVKIQELTARISVITLLLEYDGKSVSERGNGSTSISSINVKQISGYSTKELVEELGGIYLELRDIELNLQ